MVERDGEGLTELEFVLAMLIELKIINWDQVKPFIKQFRFMDVDGNARLGHDDLSNMLNLSEMELRAMRSRAEKAGEASMSVSARAGLSYKKPKTSTVAEASEERSAGE